MDVFVPRERAEGERRVAITPETIAPLVRSGVDVRVEREAGREAGFEDEEYAAAGASIAEPDDMRSAQVVARVAPPSSDEAAVLAEGTVLIGFTAPHRNPDVVQQLAESKVTTLAMDLVPRISRAQSIDALSSQANVAGYRAVIVAAHAIDKYFPLFMTAAGTIKPARVVVLGAGVAGLEAVATVRRLGGLVRVSDVREAAREEVESLGGEFIEVPDAVDQTDEHGYAKAVGEDFLSRQRAVLTEQLSVANAAIATAQIPGRPAPVLVTGEMVDAMPPGSVLVDLAAADGGNCELTDVGGVVHRGGVRVIPGHNLASEMPGEASALYARNLRALLDLLMDDDGGLALDLDDEVLAAMLLTHDGHVVHDRTAALLEKES